jgi:peptide/nickel transport system permease protein
MEDRRLNPQIAYEPGLRGLLRGWARHWGHRLRGWRREWFELLGKPMAIIGFVIIGFFAILALVQPLLMNTVWEDAIYDPIMGFDAEVAPHPAPPSSRHPLGTDYMGRDVLSQLALATRTSFGVGLVAAIVGVFVATLVGLLAAYYEGLLDQVLMTVSGVFLLLPAAVVLLTIGLIFDMSWFQVGLVYGVFAGLGALAITMKSHAQSIKCKLYIESGRAAGGSGWRIIRSHILPNLLSIIFVSMLFIVTGSVMIEALMSYISDTMSRYSWGTMIWQAQDAYLRGAMTEIPWHVMIPPAVSITLFCGAFYLVGCCLDEAVNPKLRSE